MHKASFCLQAEKSVHLNNYVSSYPARNPECPHDRRRECRKETPASGISLVRNCSLRRDRKSQIRNRHAVLPLPQSCDLSV